MAFMFLRFEEMGYDLKKWGGKKQLVKMIERPHIGSNLHV